MSFLSTNIATWAYQRSANNFDISYSYGQKEIEHVYQLISNKANEGHSILSDYDFFRYHSYVNGFNTAYQENPEIRTKADFAIIKSIKMEKDLSKYIRDYNVFRKKSLKKYGKSGPYNLYALAKNQCKKIFENESFIVFQKKN